MTPFEGICQFANCGAELTNKPIVEPEIPDSKSILTSNIKSEIEGEPNPQGSAPSRVSRPVISRSGPLSHAQKRLWLANNYIEDQTTYNVAFAWNLKGSLQVSKLQSALQAVVKRYEVLRTAFHLDEESSTPAQSVHKIAHISFESSSVRPEVDVHTEFINFRDHIFDLKSGLTMKALVLQVSDDLHVFMLCYHHIIMDGVSLRMFLYDLNRAYHSPSALLRPTTQYLDYTVDEQNMMKDFNLKSDLQYWKERFDRPVDPLPLLPCSRTNSRFPLRKYDTFTAHAFVDKEVVARIKENGRKVQATSFHVYGAALQALLFRLLDGTTEELCFGIADSNRLDHRYLETLGFFLNLLPLRFQVQGQSSFSELIKQTRTGIHGALAHSKVPFDVLLEELNVSRSSTHNPLFQVLLNHTLGFSEQATLAGCQMDIVEIEDASTACDLVVSIVETPGQDTAISFTMQKSLYLEEDCNRIISLYVEILDTLSKTPEISVGDFPLFAKPSILQSMEVGRGLRVDSWDGWEETISHQVDSVVKTYPDRVAVKLGLTDSSFTYRELNERAKYIAQNLVEASSTYPLRVAILCDPCLDAIASILAILRIGGTYIPLDSRNPHERLSAIISDSSPTILLCDDKKAEPATDLGKEHDYRVINMASIPSSGTKFEENLADANSPAFTLYTSGSTGTPKGIMLNHKNWLNQFASVTREFGLQQENVLQQSSPGFDMAIEQTFISLCNGGTLIIAPHSIRGDAIELTKLMLAENITYTMAVPSEYSVMLSHGAEFLRQCKYWKYGFCGGEKITDHLREQFQGLHLSDLKLINVYGPTETTVSCCRGLVPLNVGEQNHDFCLVGQVLPNYAIYIVDTKGELVPTGFPGEIYIGGIGVGEGYLNRDELNMLKFILDIYRNVVSDRQNEQELMYRTGDRGRLLADGSLVFMGRLDGDSQIKLRGQRVELDEIAHVIVQASNGTLMNAVVSARGNEPDIFLVAFVVFRNEFSTGNTERTSYLKSLRQQIPIPQYMRPATIVPLQELPLGVNGKVDRKTVDAFELPPFMASELAVKDLNINETRLLVLWQEVLPQEIIAGFEIGRVTDFFEVGGNSLLMVRLQALIEKNVPIKIPLVEMVEFCSLGDMAQRVFSDDFQDSAQTVDWEQEALVPDISTVSNESTPHSPSGDRKVVILTGATGFLGQQILKLLVSSPGIAEVHCIAVRSTSSSPREFPVRSDKVFIHNGDLSLPRLGLTETEFASLSSRGDIIVHNGADVSFLKSYSSLKKSNVGSTSELIRLSAPRLIPIHFVSSAGVAGFVPSELLPLQEISVKDYPPSEKSAAHGYQAAKWVSERLLEKAAAKYGIKVTLHRPTGIIGEHASGNDIVANFLRYSRKLAAVPDMEGWDGYFDFVRVEEVAQTIYSSITRDWTSEPLATVIHDCNADAFPVQQLGRYIEMEDKRPLVTLPINEWIEQAGKVGMDEMVSMYLREVTLRRMGSYPRVIKAR
jgi:amino acid adenylation domain-containing protein/thioester reductase-like protein